MRPPEFYRDAEIRAQLLPQPRLYRLGRTCGLAIPLLGFVVGITGARSVQTSSWWWAIAAGVAIVLLGCLMVMHRVLRSEADRRFRFTEAWYGEAIKRRYLEGGEDDG